MKKIKKRFEKNQKREKKGMENQKKTTEKFRELAKKEIKALKYVLNEICITPDSQTYIQIYDSAKNLYFCEKYQLAAEISWLLRMELTKED